MGFPITFFISWQNSSFVKTINFCSVSGTSKFAKRQKSHSAFLRAPVFDFPPRVFARFPSIAATTSLSFETASNSLRRPVLIGKRSERNSRPSYLSEMGAPSIHRAPHIGGGPSPSPSPQTTTPIPTATPSPTSPKAMAIPTKTASPTTST